MPIYEYQCMSCGKIEEALQSIAAKPLTKCKHCSGKLHKLISQSTFHLKGTGWYVTDYAGKTNSGASDNTGKQGGKPNKSATEKSSTAKTDSSKKT